MSQNQNDQQNQQNQQGGQGGQQGGGQQKPGQQNPGQQNPGQQNPGQQNQISSQAKSPVRADSRADNTNLVFKNPTLQLIPRRECRGIILCEPAFRAQSSRLASLAGLGNVLQYLPWRAWQLGNVHRDKEGERNEVRCLCV